MTDTLSSLLKDTWYFFFTHFGPLCSIILPVILPLNIYFLTFDLYALHGNGLPSWSVMIPAALLYPVYQGALILYMASSVSGKPHSNKQYYFLSLTFWWPLMVLYVLIVVTLAFGLLLLIIPGLIAIARLSFAEFHCILNKQSPVNAYRSSINETKEYQWLILSGLIVLFILGSCPIWIIDIVLTGAGVSNSASTFILAIANSILMIPLTIFGFRVYTLHHDNLRKQSPQSTLEEDGSAS